MRAETAIDLVRSLCNTPPVMAMFADGLRDAITRDLQCALQLGSAVTRDQAPYWIHWFGGELFVFKLLHRQARAMNLGPHASQLRKYHFGVSDGPPAPPLLSLEKLEMLTPTFGERIVCRCDYRLQRDPYDPAAGHVMNYGFRLDCTTPALSSGSLFTRLAVALMPEGSLQLTFATPGKAELAGAKIAAVFLRCSTRFEPGTGKPATALSNPLGAVLDMRSEW